MEWFQSMDGIAGWGNKGDFLFVFKILLHLFGLGRWKLVWQTIEKCTTLFSMIKKKNKIKLEKTQKFNLIFFPLFELKFYKKKKKKIEYDWFLWTCFYFKDWNEMNVLLWFSFLIFVAASFTYTSEDEYNN